MEEHVKQDRSLLFTALAQMKYYHTHRQTAHKLDQFIVSFILVRFVVN